MQQAISNLFEDTQQAVQFIQQQAPIMPRVGIVLGSGLGAFAKSLTNVTRFHYADLPGFTACKVVGHTGELILGTLQDIPCALLNGRIHAYEGHASQQTTLGVRVLATLGIKTLLLTNAAGGINPAYRVGDLMVITDHLNLTGDNPLRGINDSRFGAQFVDMTTAYCHEGRAAWQRAAQQQGITLHEGIYAGLMGPSYETPAEIRMLATLGADAVGFSTVAETIVARQMNVKVAALSVVTNAAAGLGAEALSHQEVTDTAKQQEAKIGTLLKNMIAQVHAWH